MSQAERTTRRVEKIIRELVAGGTAEFRPGDVAERLREINEPLGTWAVRAELSKLEAAGIIAVDENTGAWQLCDPDASRKAG